MKEYGAFFLFFYENFSANNLGYENKNKKIM